MIFGSRKKIIYVEDEPGVRQTAVFVLESWGLKVIEASNGTEALDKIKREKPDIILLDINIPGDLNGLEVCKLVKTNEHTSHIPVILLTGMGKTKDVDQGFEYGANDYIVKPVNWDMLKAKISKYLKL